VGIVQDLYIDPKSFTSCFIDVYIINSTGKLELLHRTPVEDVPYSFYPFKGKLMAGVGNSLKLYELGKKKLLLKSEMRGF
jgi:splicing factor 3B subunit 3